MRDEFKTYFPVAEYMQSKKGVNIKISTLKKRENWYDKIL